ncbi:MAG: DUF3413 domain-containing protein, partial [Gammaproteobacteria bacterium]|nr:DUF3413 domain-containing protein [Gammaproteobacteria bacterium]
MNMQQSNRKQLLNSILWSSFFNGIIASLISLPAIITTSQPGSLFATIYLILQQLGHFQFFSFIAAIPLLLITIVLPLKKLIPLFSVLL